MTLSTCWRPPIARVARLGFGCGWLLLAPTFLNFGLPAVLVDHRLVQVSDLKLESFATHNPSKPWHDANACLRYLNGTLWVWQLEPEQFIAAELQTGPAARLAGYDRIVLLIGDTYDVQLSWSALWRCEIGACGLEWPT